MQFAWSFWIGSEASLSKQHRPFTSTGRTGEPSAESQGSCKCPKASVIFVLAAHRNSLYVVVEAINSQNAQAYSYQLELKEGLVFSLKHLLLVSLVHFYGAYMNSGVFLWNCRAVTKAELSNACTHLESLQANLGGQVSAKMSLNIMKAMALLRYNPTDSMIHNLIEAVCKDIAALQINGLVDFLQVRIIYQVILLFKLPKF